MQYQSLLVPVRNVTRSIQRVDTSALVQLVQLVQLCAQITRTPLCPCAQTSTIR